MVIVLLCLACIIIPASAAESDIDASLPFIVSEGSIYYESSYDFGSGRYGVVNNNNRYTTSPCRAAINGYSFLNEQGQIILADYDESTDNITIPEYPDTAVCLFLHFKTSNYRNGWTNSDNFASNIILVPADEQEPQKNIEDAEQKPEVIVKDIEQILQQDQKTTIVIDYSGSMSDNQREVIDLLDTLDFQDTSIIVFADTYEVITQEQLMNEDFSIGGQTHMIQALNEATTLGTEQLMIISDLGTYEDVLLNPSDTLKSVIIYDPDGYRKYMIENTLKVIWNQVTFSYTHIS